MQRIILDQTEEKIRQVLVAFAAEYAKKTSKSITLRITGGWVRDKLLGRDSHDIDIAIDNATGQEFATALQEWMASNNQEAHGVHTIARNPEKSKHLETATTRLMGLDIDFVNLRSEKYSNDSRIPVIEFGTPYEDAMRRDATLNALFYNLTLQRVEDYTERGLQDLARGMLCTPLDPVETFRDDPLRVLRLMRFVAQLNFDLDQSVVDAMSLDEIHADIIRKVSRERVGVELDKLVNGQYALKGLQYLVQLGANEAIFTIPEPFKIAGGILPGFNNLLDRLGHTSTQLANGSPKDSAETSSLWLATLLEGWQDSEVTDPKNKSHPASYIALKESVKLPTSRANLITKLLVMATHANDIVDSTDRLDLGHFVRESNKEWELVLEYASCKYQNPQKFQALKDRIYEYELDHAYDFKPLLRGSQIMTLYPERKAGAWLNGLIKAQIQAQIQNPHITTEEIVELLKNNCD